MSGAFESTLLNPVRSTNKLFMETGFGVNAGFERYRNSEYPVSDGATSNRAQIYGPFDASNNPREWIAGAASLTIAARVTVPTSNPSPTAYIYMSAPATSGEPGVSQLTALGISIYGTGELNIKQVGTSSVGNQRLFGYAGFRSTYSSQTGLLKIYLVQGTTNPVVTWNGVDISANFTASTSGTPPAWLDASMVPTYRLVGYNWPSGPAPIVTAILGQTSAADDAFYMQTGKWPAWVVRGGSMAAIPNPTAWTNYSGYATFSSASGAAVSAVVPSTGYVYAPLGTNETWSDGVYVFTGTLVLNSGNAPFLSLCRGVGTIASNEVQLTAGAFTIVLRSITGGDPNHQIQLRSYGAGDWAITGLTPRRGGALSLHSVQPINVVDDVSTIGTNCGLILGAATTATSNKKVWRIADLTKTSGNEQILGGAVFVGTSQDYIKSWTIVNAGGTTTVSLGNVSGGAQYVSGLSVPTGTTVVTLLTNVPLTTNLWCNANTTASLTHIIEGYRTV